MAGSAHNLHSGYRYYQSLGYYYATGRIACGFLKAAVKR